MTHFQLKPAQLAHLQGEGILQLNARQVAGRHADADYTAYPQRGKFICGPGVAKGDLARIAPERLSFTGFGESGLERYTVSADVYLDDLSAFPEVHLSVARVYEARPYEQDPPAGTQDA